MSKRKASLQLLSDESDDPFVKGNAAKKNKTTSKRVSRLEEYDDDEGRESSRNFQRWAEIFESNTKGEAIKSKTFMKNFRAKVQKQKDRVHEYIQEWEKKLAETKDQPAKIFEKLYSAVASPPGMTKGTGDESRSSSKEGHILFKETQAAISGGRLLLTRFKEADEQLKNFKLELPTAQWKQDNQDMKELLACGREYGEKLIEEKLAPTSYPSPLADRYKANEKEKMASDLFKDSRKKTDEGDWGMVAADQVEKFTALAKTIPFKDHERANY
ncbi:hypothetical protein F4804DRAFT_329942 [Jackrogersella minutella]|nr:hypothetical protein F4804DRAFT_329942 [Jackrogersella minutella]